MSSAKPMLRRRRLPHVLGIGVSAVALAGLFQLQSVWAQADVEADEDPMAEELEAELEAEFEAEALEELEATATATPEPEPVAALAPAVAVAAVDAKTVTAAAVIAKAEAATEASASADAAVETETTEILPEVAALVAVPDLSGLSLRKARKQLKEVGLKMSARDGSYRIPWQEWGYYKVRKQKTEAGTMVEPGTRVRVKAREKISYGQGY